ncbi:MAG: sulfotransferase family protein [Nitrosarchaeum sp.]
MLEPKIIKPIFIVGVPRSGTTLVYRMLCLHSDLAWFSHEDLEFLIPKGTQEDLKKRFTKMKENNEKIPRNEESLFVFGLKQGIPLPGTLKVPIEAETFWANCFGREYITDIFEDKKNQVIHAIQRILEKEKKSRFLNKSPQNSMRVFALKKTFPDAKFINIARDPRSVIASMLTRLEREGHFNIGIPLKNINNLKISSLIQKFQSKSKNYDAVKNFAKSYEEITESMYDFFKSNQENCINIIYEELLAKPESEISKILEFCELEKPSDIRRLIPIMQETQNKWKEKITREDEKKIFKITKSSLEKMQYPYKI